MATKNIGIGAGDDEIDAFSPDFDPNMFSMQYSANVGFESNVGVESSVGVAVEDNKNTTQKKTMKTASFGTPMATIDEDSEEEIITTKYVNILI